MLAPIANRVLVLALAAEVAKIGSRVTQYQVVVNRNTLRTYDVTLA